MRQSLRALASYASIAGELIGFFWRHRWWVLTPVILGLLAFAGLALLGQSSAIAPLFIYTLF